MAMIAPTYIFAVQTFTITILKSHIMCNFLLMCNYHFNCSVNITFCTLYIDCNLL